MNFIKVPNLPQGPVGLAVVDGRINEKIEASLIDEGVKILKTGEHKGVYAAISYHPDIVLHHLGEEYIVYAPGISEHLLDLLRQHGFILLKGKKQLGFQYPDNVAYNVARVGNLAFHNFKYTDPILKQELIRRGIKLIDVKQGYTKCSTSIIDDNAIITADRGIAKAAAANGVETLLINSDENILLPGLSCGFIGGSTGLLDKGKWAVSGDFSTLASVQKISEFLAIRAMKVISITHAPVVDIGSILPLCEV